MKLLTVFLIFTLTAIVSPSLIHNLGGPLATYPNADNLYDLSFFFRLENKIADNVYLKILNPTGFVF